MAKAIFSLQSGARLWVVNESGNNPEGWTCLLAVGSHSLLSCLMRLWESLSRVGASWESSVLTSCTCKSMAKWLEHREEQDGLAQEGSGSHLLVDM